jgi:hypothetical protein
MFHLQKNNGRINGKCISCCYEEGDNDFYWLHCKNGKFYVFPESILVQKGYVGSNGTEKLYISLTNPNKSWCNEYLFDYNQIDKEKLTKMFSNNF